MKWQKLGKIFDPLEYTLARDFVGFAQSPQTLVLHDRVRIYFSTRLQDGNKFLSHVQYVDMSRDLTEIMDLSRHEVLPLGATGCFDEHGIFPFHVVPYKSKVYGYTTGWTRRVSVSADSGIGLVISDDDGKTFQRYGAGGPVMMASLHEPFLVADAFVREYDGILHMWYIHGTAWIKKDDVTPSDRIYKIAHATSDDGINWQREGRLIIADAFDHECQALPTVLKIGARYHMYFCYRHMFDFRQDPSKSYRIGYAYSDDLINWTRADHQAGITTTAGDWDGDMMCYPHIFACDGAIYLLYNGNQFGKHGFGAAKLVEG